MLRACVLVLIVCAAACALPQECKSFVVLDNWDGQSQIGPSTVAMWKVLETSDSTVPEYRHSQPCVSSLAVDVIAIGRPVLSIVLTMDEPSAEVDFDNGVAWGKGSVELDSACDYGKGNGVPQLEVHYAADDNGLRGGFNGSIAIFDSNKPVEFRPVANEVVVGWTACAMEELPLPMLVNATMWTQISGLDTGAVYVDGDVPVKQAYYSVGGSVNASITYTYGAQGVMIESNICTWSSGTCHFNRFQLFSVFSNEL